MKDVDITKSETFHKDADLNHQTAILNEAIMESIELNSRIINIQLVESNGLLRFWIYSV